MPISECSRHSAILRVAVFPFPSSDLPISVAGDEIRFAELNHSLEQLDLLLSASVVDLKAVSQVVAGNTTLSTQVVELARFQHGQDLDPNPTISDCIVLLGVAPLQAFLDLQLSQR